MKKYVVCGTKIAGFLSILAILIFLLSSYCAYKKSVGEKNMLASGIGLEKENSIDYIVLGDSETYTSIIPLEIYHDHGFTGYLLGTSAQRLKESRDILEESLNNQSPKLVILETNAIFRKNKPRNPSDSFDSIFTNIYKYHDNWKYYIDQNYLAHSGNEKGYVYSTKIKKSKNPDYKKYSEDRRKIPDENYEFLENIIEICKEHKITLLLLSTPSSKNWNYQKHNSIVDISEKYKLKFIDLNLDENVQINWNKDTQDEGDHLNYYGAKKVTKALGNYLADLDLLTDHREDDEYKSWENFYKKYMLKFNS